METIFDQIKLLRSQARRPAAPGAGEFSQHTIERIFRLACKKDSFGAVEDQYRELAEGVIWRRRRMAWEDVETGEDQGLCINELRVAQNAEGRVQPSVAMAYPGLVDFDAIENAYWQTTWAGGALRMERGRKASRLFINMRELTCSKPGAPRGPWEDLEALQERVAKGEWKPEFTDLIPYMNPVLRMEDGDDRIDVVRYLPAFPPSWCVQAHTDVLAATNGGYFLNFPEEYVDGLSALHQPVGALYARERLHMPPWIERPCAIEWMDGIRRIEDIGPDNLILEVEDSEPYSLVRGICDPKAPVTVWRSFDPPMPPAPADDYAVDLVFSGAGLAAVVEPGARKPPLGGAIVRLTGVLAKPWRDWLREPRRVAFPHWEMTLRTSREVPVDWVLASGPQLLHDGRVIDEAEMFHPLSAGEFRPDGPPPTRFPYDATQTRAPRTAIGITTKEEWVIVVVDGRADMAHSVGCTLEDLARLMHEMGCYFALNLDGGGSSVMAVEGIGQLDQLKPGLTSTLVNIPSDPGSRERIVPVALNVVRG